MSEAGKGVSQKAKDITGIAKLKLDIKSKEDYVNKLYMAIGKRYYEMHHEDAEPLFEEISLIEEAKEKFFGCSMSLQI